MDVMLRAKNLCAALIAAIICSLAMVAPVRALTEEQAKYVGGDLTTLGKRLAALQESAAKVVAAAPGAWSEYKAGLKRITESPGPRPFSTQLTFIAIALGLLIASVTALRAATAKLRRACLADSLRTRGVAGLLGLEALDRIVVAALAYVLVKLWFDSETIPDLLGVAILWSVVRWWLAMWLVEALLRPAHPALRLLAMGDTCARRLKWISAVFPYIGIVGISIMPLLLRVAMPIPAAQVIAEIQGCIVAAGGILAALVYQRLELAPARARGQPLLRRRLWLSLAVVLMLLVLISWTIGVLLLEFATYHALMWSLRIAGFAFIVDSVLGLSRNAPVEAGTSRVGPWIPLARRLIRVTAILTIAILLADVWLVDQLGVVEREAWEPVRHSLIFAALTLIAGYAAWCYLDYRTEAQLTAATQALDPTQEDMQGSPASRLTTVLPMLRVLFGITIIVMAVLVALSQLGVNIGPLLAGAGVFGLAISFGSQALVRDVVSGIFFLSDDAFRLGEYIDTGRLKGVVEKISMRSVRLRHQNGQIHTIPFGQLTSITNYSRDWQTVKFNIRLARDTDLEKARKAVKQIGLDMMEDPELAKELLLPLKMQGVAEITDNAIVARLKFTTRPQNPSGIQRDALKRLYREFAAKGINFASGAIMVQTANGGPPDEAVAGAAASAANAARQGQPA